MEFDKFIKELMTNEKCLEFEQSEEETKALSNVIEMAKRLRESLNDNQLSLFSDYICALSDYKAVSEKRAFLVGVRLAAEYFTKKRG